MRKPRKFTEEELNNIIEDYNNGVMPKDLAVKYDRNSGTIIGKLQELGIYKMKNHRYTEDEIEFIKEHYPKGELDVIFDRIPDINIQSLRTFCSKHGIKADYFYDVVKWTDEELKIVEEHYYDKSNQELVDLMSGRHTIDAIQTKALRRFGYSKDRTWTDNEIDILREYYPIESVDDVCVRLPNRTRDAIIKQANKMNIKNSMFLNTYWSESDERLLIDNWDKMCDDDLSVLIGKNRRSILEKRWYLGLLRLKHYNEASYIDLSKYIRGNIGTWKSDSMKNCDYKCVLTGDKDFHIHHLYSFSSIFNEVIEENNINLKYNFSDYTKEELSFVVEKFIEKQNSYPLGVCVRKDLHKLFHQKYGNVVVPEMWYEFAEDYKGDKYVS